MTFRCFIPVLALAAAACEGAPNAIAQSAPAASRTMTVSGVGEAAATPDMAIIRIGVETEGPSAAVALNNNSANMRGVIDTLKELGVEERDIQTSNLTVNPRYDYNNSQNRPRLIGFVAGNTVTVQLRDLENVGAVLDETVQAGANTINQLTFAFADPKPLYDEARTAAVAHAKAQAELLSEAAGVRLGPILTIHDGHVGAPTPRKPMARLEAAFDQSVPIASGESMVTANVTIIYEIQ